MAQIARYEPKSVIKRSAQSKSMHIKRNSSTLSKGVPLSKLDGDSLANSTTVARQVMSFDICSSKNLIQASGAINLSSSHLAPVTSASSIDGPKVALRAMLLERNCKGRRDPLDGMKASTADSPARARTAN